MLAKSVQNNNQLDQGVRRLFQSMDRFDHELRLFDGQQTYGRVSHVAGPIIRASVSHVSLGELCRLHNRRCGQSLLAEVVGFQDETVLLAPFGSLGGISRETVVMPTGQSLRVPVGPGLLGRVIDSLGRPIDEPDRAMQCDEDVPVLVDAPNPMTRKLIETPFVSGVKAIDAFMTCAQGQRMGVFSTAGLGKSALLKMLASNATADVIVVALIGDRGREVREFVRRSQGEQGLARAVIVVATADRPAMERLKCAYTATAIAEYFRDQGQHVLLLMDSVTGLARARRDISLATGEPSTRPDCPPSVLTGLPGLLERAGPAAAGSITAFYTVLLEDCQTCQPIADEVRAIVDGHIVLSASHAAGNHYPAIDVLASSSLLMNTVVDGAHQQAANHVRRLLAQYQEMTPLPRVSGATSGQDPLAYDQLLAKMQAIDHMLRQTTQERVSFEQTMQMLLSLACSE